MTQEELNQRSEKRFMGFIEALENLSAIFSPVPKKIPEQAHPIWKMAIKGFTLAQAKKVLTEWPLQNTRMILPADLTKELNRIRSEQIEAHAEEIRRQDNEPVNIEVPKGFEQMVEVTKRAGVTCEGSGGVRWAKRLQVLEAYGFRVFHFSAQAWRSALFKIDYRFEDMPSLPYHHPSKCYEPKGIDPDDGGGVNQKFLFFYEQVVGSFDLVEGVEDQVFGLMDHYGPDYWIKFFEDQKEAA